jgi:hypothetical protein
MATLESTIKKKLKSTTSKENVKFYTEQRKQFIEEMASSPETVTRIQVAASSNVPAYILRKLLLSDEDVDVLRTVLMNPRTPMNAIEKFLTKSIAQQFNDDEEIVACLQSRICANMEKNPFEEDE